MNWYNLNIPINSIMLLSTYIWIDSIKLKEWLKRFNQINQSTQYICMLAFVGKPSISLMFFGKRSILLTFFWDILNQFNWFNRTSPSKSIDPVTYFMKMNRLSQQSWKRNCIESINFAEKVYWFKSINSVELIGVQVRLQAMITSPSNTWSTSVSVYPAWCCRQLKRAVRWQRTSQWDPEPP